MTSSRGRRYRRSWGRRPFFGVAGTIVLLAFVLGMPIIVAANPIDSLWLTGWYDEADGDLLVANTISPEKMIGTKVLTLGCILSDAAVVARSAQWCSREISDGAIARGPPTQSVVSRRSRSLHVVHLAR